MIVIVLTVAAMVMGGAVGAPASEEIQRSFRLASGQEIAVQSRNGSITYEAWDGDEVSIRAVKRVRGLVPFMADWIEERSKVEITETAGGVRASFGAGWGWFHVVVNFYVLVPRGWEGDISLHTSNGPITARDLVGDAELRTSNGPIVVERQSGSLRARTSNGRIEMRELHGNVDAETSNGSIVVNGATLTSNGRLRTSNGTVDVRAKLEAGASYELRTSNGAVRIGLVDPDVQVDLTTSNGDIELDTEVAVSEVGRSRLAGRIGAGSARLVARTSNGDITLASLRSTW